MSGGHFDYAQYRIEDITRELEDIIHKHDSGNSEEYNYSKETYNEFKRGLLLLKQAQIYAQRIDWLLSGDDGEEDFFLRLAKELRELEENEENA